MPSYPTPGCTVVFSCILASVTVLTINPLPLRAAVTVAIHAPAPAAAPLQKAVQRLERALAARGATVSRAREGGGKPQLAVAVGIRGDGSLADTLAVRQRLELPDRAESFLIRCIEADGRRVWICLGRDARGTMYGCYEVAERIELLGTDKNPFEGVRDVTRAPVVKRRAVSMYTFHRRYFEERLFNPGYWEWYFDWLARNRFNTFVLIFGYENGGYMAPPYPYFFDVDGFPEVRVVGWSHDQQKAYRDGLRRLIEQAHEHGLDVILGIWDHIYRGRVQSGGVEGADPDRPRPGFVYGLNTGNFMPYNERAFPKFLATFPEIDGVQFRMHWESGLTREETPVFWRRMFRAVRRAEESTGRRIRLYLRAKGLPDEVIDMAIGEGLDFAICTKYWAEQMGLPFHPSHINRQNQHDRRHGYADLLRYPVRYEMNWRLWNGGTNRILVWGSAEYVRRFVDSTRVYPTDGIEVNEPLCTKMEAQPHDWPPFQLLSRPYRYYTYEFERYWPFFMVWGRLSYDPGDDLVVYAGEFKRRFGPEVGPVVEAALEEASWILPRIIASIFPYNRFPMTRGWVEKQRWEDLPAYAEVEGSDIEQFTGHAEAAELQIRGLTSAKIHPFTNARWLLGRQKRLLASVEQIERAGSRGIREPKELQCILVDLRILAQLAGYHGKRVHAGVNFALFRRTGDVSALDRAIRFSQEAVTEWEGLVRYAGDVYARDLMMGLRRAGLAGHWRDELHELREELARLRQLRRGYRPEGADRSLVIAHAPVRRALPGDRLTISATVDGPADVRGVVAVIRNVDGAESRLHLKPSAPRVFSAAYLVPPVNGEVVYWLEAEDADGRRSRYPETGEVRVVVTNDAVPPVISAERVEAARPGRPLVIEATVRDASGVGRVQLLYRPVNQMEDYRALEMHRVDDAKGRYRGVIPADELPAQYDLMYMIRAFDRWGNGTRWPSLEKETPYVVVRLHSWNEN